MPPKKPVKKVTPAYSTRTLRGKDRKRVTRGKDLYGYGERKHKINLTLTPTAIAKLTELAEQLELSRSETIEQLFRNHYKALVTMLHRK